ASDPRAISSRLAGTSSSGCPSLVTETDGVGCTLDSGAALDVGALEIDVLGVGVGVGDGAAACFPEYRVSASTSPTTNTAAHTSRYHARRCEPGADGGFGGGSESSHSTSSGLRAMSHHPSARGKRPTACR